ncbi:MAG: HEAT repeat domain-containing protein [Planctomycetia bacterium]|nr:HEAT repeat domain-containing protein [Planctomycetia bacterium]
MRTVCILSLVSVLIPVGGVFGEQPRGIDELVKALDGEDTRYEAIRELEDLGLDAGPAVARLTALLDSPDKATRAAAADALGAIGKDATAAIPKLVALLGEGELPRISTEVGSAFSAVGIRAASALGNMGKDAVPLLVPCLTDKRSAVRSNAACALYSIGSDAQGAVAPLIAQLKDSDWFVRQCAAEALGNIRSAAGQSIPALIETLKDENFNVRRTAASALGAIRPTTPTAVEALIRALSDEDGDVPHEAAEALAKLGDEAIPAISALTDLLKSRKAYRYGHPVVFRPVAGTAARALGTLGHRAKAAMPALIETIQDRKGTFERYGADDRCDNYEARGEAAIAAARIDPRSDELLRVLGESLQEDDWIRGEVAVALALIGPKAKGMVPALLRFTEPDPRFAGQLACACAAVDIERDNAPAVEKMLELLPPEWSYTDGGWDLLRTALTRAGTRSRRAIPILIMLVKDTSRDHENAARTLATFGPEAQSAIPTLLDLLAHTWEPREEAIAALAQIASEKSPPLLAALESRDVNVRSGVVEVLGHFPGSVPLLTEALKDPSARVRLAALRSLAKLGRGAKPAIGQIRQLLQGDSRTLREAAAFALQKAEQSES